MIKSTIRRVKDDVLKEVKSKNDSIVELVQNQAAQDKKTATDLTKN